MRVILMIPVVLLAAAAAGMIACTLAAVDPQWKMMLWAAGVCFIAAETAIFPLALARKADPATAAQAGLVSTLLYLLLALVLGGAAFFLLKLSPAVIYWLLAFYWITLATLVVACLQAVRQAAATPHAS